MKFDQSNDLQSNRNVFNSICSHRVAHGVVRGMVVVGFVLALQIGMDNSNESNTDDWLSDFSQTLSAQQVAVTVKDPRPKRNIPAMTAETYEKIAKVGSILFPEEDEDEENKDDSGVDTRDFEQARKILDNLLKRRGLNGNERAQVHQTYASLAFELDDNTLAIYHLEQILVHREHINYGMEEKTLSNLSIVHMSIEDFEKGLEYALAWYDLALNFGSRAIAYIAQIYYALEDWAGVSEWIQKAIAKSQEEQRLVLEVWWQMLYSAHIQLEEYEEALEVIKILVINHTAPKYWRMMASIYNLQEKDAEAGYTLELAHAAGMLDRGNYYQKLASLNASAEAYIRAAWILEEAFESELLPKNQRELNTLGQYYQASAETVSAKEAYEEATTDAGDVKTWHRLALTYNELELYSQCIDACDAALDTDEGANRTDIKILKGVCLYSDRRLSDAQELFEELQSYARREDNENLEGTVRMYLNSLDSEFSLIEYTRELEEAEREYRESKTRL